MELYSKIEEEKREHYFQAFEAVDDLAANISSAEFADASFGDVEAEIHKKGMEVGCRNIPRNSLWFLALNHLINHLKLSL